RSFAHTCRTGRARRTWIRGLDEVNKRYLIQAAARNLGTIMRVLIGVGTPRALQGDARAFVGLLHRAVSAIGALLIALSDFGARTLRFAELARSI
ncbi:MAG: DDE transposase, partial [Planctomycetota bacterium]